MANSKKSDAQKGRFAVTEELERYAREREERRRRQESMKDRFRAEGPRKKADYAPIAPSAEPDWQTTVRLTPDDITLEPQTIKLGFGANQLLFAFRDLVQVEAADPWPGFEVEWKQVGQNGRRRVEPRRAKQREEFAEAVVRLVRHLEERFPHAVVPGWVTAPDLPWERVKSFPDEEPDEERRADYRVSARKRPQEEIVARRSAPRALEATLDWLASSPDYPWREHPLEVVLTVHHVYARRRDGDVYRLPRSELRIARLNRDQDAVFVFGRRTLLVLPHREGDDVAKHLLETAGIEIVRR